MPRFSSGGVQAIGRARFRGREIHAAAGFAGRSGASPATAGPVLLASDSA